MVNDSDEKVASCKLMEVKKEVPSWLKHRNKVLASTYTNKAPSDESESTSSLSDANEEAIGSKEDEYDDEAAKLFYRAGGNETQAKAWLEKDEEPPKTKEDEYDNEAAQLFRRVGGNEEGAKAWFEKGETTSTGTHESNNTTTPESQDDSSDDSMVDHAGADYGIISTDGSSGWSTPLEFTDSSKLSDTLEPPPTLDSNEVADEVEETEMISESNGEAGDSSTNIIEESWRTEVKNNTLTKQINEGQESRDYIEESLSTDGSYETVTEHELEDPTSIPKRLPEDIPQLPEDVPPAPLEPDTTNEKFSHSAASFWGNPVRFADPFRENEVESEEGKEYANPYHREPGCNKTMWAYERSQIPSETEEGESLDPPAAMDGSLHRISYDTKILHGSPKINGQNPWMPPSTHERKDGDEDETDFVTTTIAETMERLQEGESPVPQTPITNNASTIPQDPSEAVSSRKGAASTRIDFAGHTNAHITNANIRKYYDKGRNANEDMRRLYMPTAIPAIPNLPSEEEELFDWVPKKYKTGRGTTNDNDKDSRSGYGISTASGSFDEQYLSTGESYASNSENYTRSGENYTSADENYTSMEDNYTSTYTSADEYYRSGTENYTSADDQNYASNYGDDIETNRSGYSSYDESAMRDGKSYDGTSVDIDILDSERKPRLLSSDGDDRGTFDTVDLTAIEPHDSNQDKIKLFPCHCIHVGICLIIFLVPGIVFGIRYYPQWSTWIRNLFS